MKNSRSVFLTIAILILVPNLVYASWWNPLTWFDHIPLQTSSKIEILTKSAASNPNLNTSTPTLSTTTIQIPKKVDSKPIVKTAPKPKVIVVEPVKEVPIVPVPDVPKVSLECENWNKLNEELIQKESEYEKWKQEELEPKRLQNIEKTDQEYNTCVANLASGEKLGKCSIAKMHASSNFMSGWLPIMNEKQDPIKKIKKELKKSDPCKPQ